ncbi:MAG: hypothetical protein ACI9YT_002984, partial [Halobacteriales archaeon]
MGLSRGSNPWPSPPVEESDAVRSFEYRERSEAGSARLTAVFG